MQLRDSRDGYGLISRLLHWSMAVVIVALFGLGLWMVRLDYYSPYYNSAPSLHKAIGMIAALALAFRLLWRGLNDKPDQRALGPQERRAARLAHLSLYLLLIGLVVTGYLISTADGRPIDVFGLVEIPSLVRMQGVEDLAGDIHRWLAYGTIALASIHALAAFKHHLIDRSPILTRMWSGPPKF